MTHTVKLTAANGANMTFHPEQGGIASSLQWPDAKGQLREWLYWPQHFETKCTSGMGGGWPFCFPICGRLARVGEPGMYLYRGRQYQLDMHGFAYQLPWQVIAQETNQLTLQLVASDRTRDSYPFEFELTLAYHLHEKGLQVDMRVHNHDEKPMPYHAGFHPYFATPADKTGITLDFDAHSRLLYNKDLTDIRGTTEPLATPVDITEPAVNESLHRLADEPVVAMRYPNGQQLQLSIIGHTHPHLFEYLQLYHDPQKPFFCIEPWMGHPNAINTINAMHWLSPGQTDHATLVCWLKNK